MQATFVDISIKFIFFQYHLVALPVKSLNSSSSYEYFIKPYNHYYIDHTFPWDCPFRSMTLDDRTHDDDNLNVCKRLVLSTISVVPLHDFTTTIEQMYRKQAVCQLSLLKVMKLLGGQQMGVFALWLLPLDSHFQCSWPQMVRYICYKTHEFYKLDPVYQKETSQGSLS